LLGAGAVGRGKVVGQPGLFLAEHVHGVARSIGEDAMHLRITIHVKANERRLQC